MGENEGTEEGINIMIKRAYIERLEFDFIEKAKLVWHDVLDAIGKAWDALLGIPPSTAKSISKGDDKE